MLFQCWLFRKKSRQTIKRTLPSKVQLDFALYGSWMDYRMKPAVRLIPIVKFMFQSHSATNSTCSKFYDSKITICYCACTSETELLFSQPPSCSVCEDYKPWWICSLAFLPSWIVFALSRDNRRKFGERDAVSYDVSSRHLNTKMTRLNPYIGWFYSLRIECLKNYRVRLISLSENVILGMDFWQEVGKPS